ncbi:MAG: 3-deoxy-manno-octulosonate cytidylyltransferase, partial [Bacteroidia bacterium]|nr:3-deoxy-manno-octulosonate cytidylyltransferase [Bacteroidia bacterium]
GNVEMTSSHHLSGTDRIGEVAKRHLDYEIIVNIQGDEPFIQPEQISLVLEPFFQQDTTEIATLVQPFDSVAELQNPNSPKVILSLNGTALYFSRAVIPYPRVTNGNLESFWGKIPYWKHIGIYAWKNDILQKLIQLPPSMLEQTESLEQLRWLENGYTIHTRITHHKTWAIDTPQDLENLQTVFEFD